MSYAVRGKRRTFYVLFLREETGDPFDPTNPVIEIFHYDDLDGATGTNKIVDVPATALISDPEVGHFHFVWAVPYTKPLRQVHYALSTGDDPITGRTGHCEEIFSIIDDTDPSSTPSPCGGGGMTCSFVKN